jgi:hypothetical protein
VFLLMFLLVFLLVLVMALMALMAATLVMMIIMVVMMMMVLGLLLPLDLDLLQVPLAMVPDILAAPVVAQQLLTACVLCILGLELLSLLLLLLPLLLRVAAAEGGALAMDAGIDPVLDAAAEFGVRDEGPVLGGVEVCTGSTRSGHRQVGRVFCRGCCEA